MSQSYPTKLANSVRKLQRAFVRYWQASRWHKTLVILGCVGLMLLGSMYGIAQWYIATQNDKPLQLGTSFIPAYAEKLGVEPKAAMDAMITDLGVEHFRLVSYWDQIELNQGVYDFSSLDWQFEKAEAAGARISLSLGLRQPRWPECHMPGWAGQLPDGEWQTQLNNFIEATVNRYKHSPSLENYQLENEYFLRGFGICTNFDRDRLISEYNLVKQTDPNHPVIISRSNNALGIALGQPTPDEYGISIYKRVWSMPIGRYLEYPFPAWYYGFLAGLQKIVTGKDTMIHELQMEAWPPNGQEIVDTSLEEQNKSIDAKRFTDRVAYGKATGMREIYLWGSEYWYYRLIVLNDPSLWDAAKTAFRQAN